MSVGGFAGIGVLDQETGRRIITLRGAIVRHFTASNWTEVGLMFGVSDIIGRHPRLLRSLNWNDEDYDGNVLEVLQSMVLRNLNVLSQLETYVGRLDRTVDGTYVSARPSERRITFAPNVFTVPEGNVEPDLVAVMMPFNIAFRPTYEAIQRSCRRNNLRCERADDFWQESTFIQDIFNLIFRAKIVIVDFSGKNPNVMYETGIAHTLGKAVVPISQTLVDVPSDIQHHRAYIYLSNTEGLAALEQALTDRLSYLVAN